MPDLAAPRVPVSWGELLDKIAILEIKQRRIAEPGARANVARELAALSAIAAGVSTRSITPLLVELRRVNELLWDIEDAVRREDAHGRFGAEFVRLARQVYRRNDERAAIKRAINERLGSELIEEKSYALPPPLLRSGALNRFRSSRRGTKMKKGHWCAGCRVNAPGSIVFGVVQ